MNHFYTYVYQNGNNLYQRGYSNGKPFSEEIEYRPYLFIPGNGDYKDIFGNPYQKKYFSNINHAHASLKQWSQSKVCGLSDFLYAFINDEFPGHVNYDFNLISVVSIDIEVDARQGLPNIDEALQEITAITLTKKDQILTLGTKLYNGKYKDNYYFCPSEQHLLIAFINFLWSPEWSPDVLTGWNIDRFDIPYLVNRIRRILGQNYVEQLSPWGFVKTREISRGKSTANGDDEETRREVVYEIAGVTQLDYMQLYKRFNPVTQESYSLNNIASVELGEKKIDWKLQGYKDLTDLYDRNFELYIDYNIHDALLVQRLEERLGFILLVISIAYKAKINYLDAFTTVKPWDIIIHSYLLDRKIVIPQKPKDVIERELIGAYCKDPQRGMHHWVVSFDFEGEYPSAISQCNISPETFVEKIPVPPLATLLTEGFGELTEYAKKKNCCITANGCLYRKDIRGFIPELVDEYKADRAKVKGQLKELKKADGDKNEIIKLDNFQQAIKILTNGLYGALSNIHFRWFNIDLAESVTMTSQLATRYMEVCVNKYLNNLLKTEDDYVIAADTDSNYIVLNRLVNLFYNNTRDSKNFTTEDIVNFLDQVCRTKFKALLEYSNLELSKWLNSYKQVLKMNQDIIASKAIWTAKKRYITLIHDKEGVRYKKPELYYKGIEVVRSNTPMVCRKNLRECLNIIMNEDEESLRRFIQDFEQTFRSLGIVDIARPSSVKGMNIYSKGDKGLPIHVRGALNYNQLRKDYNLEKIIPPIRDADKIKFVYLLQPNPIKDYVISFHEEIPEQWGLNLFVDYDTQWEKSFIKPLKVITNSIGWNLTKVDDLTSFFV